MDLDMRDTDASAGTGALEPDLQAQDGDFPLPLLPGDEAPAGDDAAPAELILPEEPAAAPTGDPESRKRRRADWERTQAVRRRWELQRRVADISTDVEALSREVTRVRADLHVPLPPLAALPEFERQTLAAAHARRLADILHSHCRKALAAVMQHKWSWPFNAPVDTNIYKDYLEKVETPMDFGTIKRKLDAKEYTHPDTFGAEMRLVFANAKAYNKPGSDVHVMAATLEEKFEERYTSTVANRVTEENTVAEAEAMAARKRYAGAAAAAAGGARAAAEARAAQLVRAVDQMAAAVADAKSAAAAACAPVSRAEKETLAAALGRLPQAHFEAAVGIVMHHHPGLQPFDEVGFDLDMLDALTLRQLISFVAAAEAAGPDAAQVPWPALPVGSGLRPFTGKRRRRAAPGAAAPTPSAAVERATTPAAGEAVGAGAPGVEQTPAAAAETPAATLAAPLPPMAASEAPVAPVEAAAAAPAAGTGAEAPAPAPASAVPNGTANGSVEAVAPPEAAAPAPAAEDAGPAGAPAAEPAAPVGAAAPEKA